MKCLKRKTVKLKNYMQMCPLSTLDTRVVKLGQQIDENSAHERKNTLIMAGTIPPASQADDCKFIVREQIRDHLRL